MINIDIIIQDLGKRIGVPISIIDGACIITTSDREEIWFECPEDSALIVVHCLTKDGVHEHSLSPSEMQKILELNGRLDITKGGWLALHKETKSLRLCVSLPKNLIDAETLEIVIDNTFQLNKVIKEILSSPTIESPNVRERMNIPQHQSRGF